MKKLFCLILVITLISLFALPCFAESVEIPETEEITLGERLSEFWNKYTAEILSGGGIATTLGLIIFLWKKIKPLLLKLLKAENETADVQDKQSKAINSLIDGTAAVDEKLAKIEEKVITLSSNDNRNAEHFKEVQRALVDIAKLLDTVYSHSSVLSQATKNMVHTYCADCIKIAEHEINGDVEVSENVKSN
jgi:hypothetical protein